MIDLLADHTVLRLHTWSRCNVIRDEPMNGGGGGGGVTG